MSEKVIGGPIDAGVIAQIKLREDVYSSNKRREDPQVLQFMNSRTGWVKFQSSVNVNRSSKLAQDYILIGGVLGRTGIDTYRDYPNGLGFRPMPGITGVQVTSINRFGLLKEATVSINCWDLKQLEDLEQLYMRPGYTALLEWGHSMYYNNGKTSTLQSIPKTLEGYFSGGISKQQIYDRIKTLKQSTSYNYDGIFAFIKNFSWSYRSDGGYDCTVSLMSIGEIIESLTVCIDSTSLGDKAASNVDNTTPPLPTLLQNVLKIIKDKGVDSWTQLTIDLPNFTGKFGEVSGLGTINVQSLPLSSIVTQKEQLPGTEQKFSFLKMDTFCAMINTVLLVENNKAGIVRLSTQKNASNTYRNYSQHVSSDPGICLIVTPSVDTWLAPIPFSGGGSTGFEFLGSISTAGNDIFNTQTTSTILEELRQGQSDQASDEILNIWLNVDFIASEIDKLVQSPPDQRTLVNLMNPILSQINEALGGINELALHYEEESFTWYIVDRSVQVEKSHALSLINLVGLRSTVSEVSLVTKLPKDITTMMAISAQANAADLGIETGALLQWNKGLTDRIIKTKSVNLDKIAEDESSLNEKTQAILSEQMFIVRTFLNNIFNNGQYNYDEAAAARIAYGQYTTTYLQYYEDSGATTKNNSGAAGIIPFDLNITMDGISGIKIGQAFKIPGATILPPKYENRVGFIVTGVDHDITANRWTTKLKAQVILLEKASKSKVTAKLYERKIIIRQNNEIPYDGSPINYTTDGSDEYILYLNHQQGAAGANGIFKSSIGLGNVMHSETIKIKGGVKYANLDGNWATDVPGKGQMIAALDAGNQQKGATLFLNMWKSKWSTLSNLALTQIQQPNHKVVKNALDKAIAKESFPNKEFIYICCFIESRYDPNAITTSKTYKGLFQMKSNDTYGGLFPAIGENWRNPTINAANGIKIVKQGAKGFISSNKQYISKLQLPSWIQDL